MKLLLLLYWFTVPSDSLPKPDSLYFYGANRAKLGTNSCALLRNFAYTNALSYLNGAGTGIQVHAPLGHPGADSDFTIRGKGVKVSKTNIVVNGMPYFGSFADIHALDIESMEILKDPVSSNMYGGDPLMPVIRIQTKRLTKQRFTFTINTGLAQDGAPKREMLNAQTYYEYSWSKYRSMMMDWGINANDAAALASGLWPRNSEGKQNYNGLLLTDLHGLLGNPKIYNVPNLELIGVDGKINPKARLLNPDNLNWGKTIARTALRNEIHTSYSNTLGPLQIYSSLSYLKEDGWARHSDNVRKTGTISISYSPAAWLKIGYDGYKSTNNGEVPNTTRSSTNPIHFARTIAPIYPVYQQDSETGQLLIGPGGEKIPYSDGFNIPYSSLENYIVNNVSMERNMNRGYIQLRPVSWATYQVNFGVNKRLYESEAIANNLPSTPLKTTDIQNEKFTQQQHLLNLTKTINSFHIDLTAAYEYFKRRYDQSLRTFSLPRSEVVNQAEQTEIGTLLQNRKLYRHSYLAHLVFRFKDVVRVEGSFRKNNESREISTQTYAAYWRPIKKGQVEVHAAWGRNSKIPANLTYLEDLNGLYAQHLNSYFSTGISALRLIKLTYYNRVNEEIFNYILPSYRVETYTYKNTGVEMELGTLLIDRKKFQWDSRIFLSMQSNTITEMPKAFPMNIVNEYALQEDYPINAYFLRRFTGLDPDTGLPTYKLPNGGTTTVEGLAMAEITRRSSLPKFFGSWVNDWRFNRLQCRIVMNYQLGAWMQDLDHRLHANFYQNYRSEILDLPWEATYPPSTTRTDRWLTRSDYLSINQLHISYGLSKHVRLQLNGENLYFWAKEKGFNPLNAGSDTFTYSLARRYNLGAQISF